ncbi:MAG: 4-(cytidine 5'-diphospho)-2-C-methyl-D-erythritol kinase [Bacteroidetes bacterium]|nr:4-(cytidine 5'-diphospho)-2-C-methyl-D-erythritol kinase [Bacteroidota bacterium]
MIFYSNAKINIGLNVIERLHNGYHTIETVFYPINWADAIEILDKDDDKNTDFNLTIEGLAIEGNVNDNLIYKAYRLIKEQYPQLPPLNVILYKTIPMGAGLGGGSSNAAFFINAVNSIFDLNIPLSNRLIIASQLGADCAFFIENKPVFASGIGNIFSNINLNLSAYYIAVVYPKVHSNTKEAYQLVKPQKAKYNLKDVIENCPVSEWKNFLKNDFEEGIFKKHAAIAELKEKIYQNNAIYASMSGSGSAVYGIFIKKPELSFVKEYNYKLIEPKIVC